MATLVTDPVCDMTIDAETAPAQSEYRGVTYYFCAIGCKEEFDTDPEKYAKHKAERPLEPPAEVMASTMAPTHEEGGAGEARAGAGGRRWWEFWKSG